MGNSSEPVRWIFQGNTAHEAVDFIPLFEEQFGQI
jgi:hypothetical protein